MNWFDDYLSNIGKKKKKNEEEKTSASSLQKNEDLAPVGGRSSLPATSPYAVPVSGTAPYAAASGLNLAPVKIKDEDKPKWYEGYVKKGAYEDGRQRGDVGKAALGTSTDFAKNFLTGAAGVVEGFADFGAKLAPLMMEQQLIAEGGRYSEGEKELYQQNLQAARKANEAFIQADTVNEEAVAKNIIAGGYAMANPGKLLWGNGKLAAGVGDVIKERYQEAMDYMAEETKDGEVVAPSQMEQNSLLDKKADALIQSAGQLAVQMGMQALGVPWWVTAGVTASASETEAALKEGATLEQAIGSGIITAGAEVLTEQIGGIKFGGKGLDDVVTKALSRAIADRFWRTAAKVGLDAFSEGMEEVLTENISRFGQWLTYRSEEELKELLFNEEAMQAKIDAFVGGGLMGGGFGTVNAVRAGNKGIDYASGMTSNEKAVVDAVYQELVDAEAAGTESGELTGKRKKEIYNEVLEQLERGDFSVETIEKVLGGEGLQNYQKAEAERAKLQEEYDELYGMKNSEKSNKQIDREAYLKERLESEENNARRDELKKKYTEGVQAMALQDRLGESYRQKSERGRAYEADLNQYTGKAKETVQKAVESGILNNTRKTHDFVDLLAKIADHTGQVFNFTDNQRLKESGFAIEGKQVNGYITKDGITLNINSPKALNRVVGHEVMHVLQEAGLTEALTEKLFQYAESKGELEGRRKAVEALYEGMEADIDGELAAELVGDYLFTNKDFVRQLNTENRNVFQKIWDEVKYLAKVATAGSKEAKELARIEKMFADVYREAGEAKNTVQEDGVRYSMSGLNSQTADADALSKAIELQEQGVSNEAIRQETGWFVGMDGKWRYEIDDSQMTISDNISNYMQLGDLMQHDQLYAAYPDLADMDIVFQSLEPGVNGSYDPQFDSINLSSRLKNDPFGIKDALAHELQHAIQRREGFTSGATVGRWERRKQQGFDSRRKEDIRKARETEQELRRIQEEEPEFYRDMLELDAMTPDLPRGAVDWDTLEKIEDDPIEWQQYDARREELETKYGDMKVWDMNDLLHQQEQSAKNTGRSALELYYDTAGEIEARDVANRQRLTPEQRKSSPPRLGNENTVFAETGSSLSYIGDTKDGRRVYESGFESSVSEEDRIKAFKNRIATIFNLGAVELKTDVKKIRIKGDKFTAQKNQYGDKKAQTEEMTAKINALYDLADILATSQYDPSATNIEESYANPNTPPKNAAHKNVKYWYKFRNEIVFDGVPYTVTFNIRDKGKDQYQYLIDFKKNKTPGLSNTAENSLLRADQASYAPIVSDSDAEVKKKMSLSDENADFAPMAEDVYGDEIGLEAPVREDLYGDVPEDFLTDADEAFGAMLDAYEIRDTRQRMEAIREHSQAEMEANKKLRQEARERYDAKIEETQAKYDAKKNKESKLAQDLLKRIERLKRLQADVDAGYSKRISDILRRLTKTDTELEKDHSRKDTYQRALAKIDRNLEQDKAALDEEFRGTMEVFEDKNAWTSQKATELYQELRHLKKGKRASAELGYLLDLRQERGWSYDSLRSAFVNVRHTPGEVVNQYSPVEKAVRELLDSSFESDREAAELDFDEKMVELEEEAEAKRIAARTSNQAKVKHEQHWEEVKDMVGDTSTWVDKPLGIQYATSTLLRNIQDVVRGADGKTDYAKAKAIYEYMGGSYNHNEAQLKQEDNAIKKWYQDQKITKEESVYIQMLGEFRYNPDTQLSNFMVEDYLNEHRDKIDEAKVDRVIEQARKDYDALFERLNAILRENGMKEIPYRKGYFPHLKLEGEQSLLAKVLNWKTRDNKLPTDIAGLTEDFNPPRSYQAFNKQRTGDKTAYDFRKGFDAYVHGALDWIYHIEDIQRRREFENYIRYIHSKEGIKAQIEEVFKDPFLNADEVQAKIEEILKNGQNPLGNFVTDLRTQTNLLAAKKHSMDRGMEQMLNRDVYSVASNISNRVSANMVAGSLSAAMSNFIPITQSWGEVDPRFTLQAAADAIRFIREDDGMVEKSDFLTNRLLEEEKLDRGFWDDAGDKVGWLMNGVDHLVSQTVWRSKYRQNLAEGMSEADAIQDADLFAERLMAGRSRGNQPTLFESKNLVAKMLTAFQLEVNNQYQYLFKDLPREMRNEAKGKLVSAHGKIFIGAYLHNALSTVITGRQQAFDPIRILTELFGGLADEEEDDTEDIKAFAEDVLEQTPFVGGLIGGGRVPISSALPYDGNVMEGITGVAKAWETKDWKDWKAVLKELENPLYYLLPPMAGGQIRKTVQGLGMFLGDEPVAGSYTDSGALRYTVDPTVGNVLQAALFGQWANQNAQQYIEEGRSPLSEKQMNEFLEMGIPIEEYWQIRDGLKGLKTVNEKADYIASLDIPVEQKNLLINNIADRKDPIDLTDYGKYDDFAELDFAVKRPELYSWLQSQGMTGKQYENSTAAKKEAYSWAAKNPEKFEVSRAVTSNLVLYRTYTKAISGIESDKDASGKTINGSRKKKVVEYINGLDLDYGSKIILYRMEFNGDDSYNYDIVEYLNSRKDLSYQEMVTILEQLGMQVDRNGNVTW